MDNKKYFKLQSNEVSDITEVGTPVSGVHLNSLKSEGPFRTFTVQTKGKSKLVAYAIAKIFPEDLSTVICDFVVQALEEYSHEEILEVLFAHVIQQCNDAKILLYLEDESKVDQAKKLLGYKMPEWSEVLKEEFEIKPDQIFNSGKCFCGWLYVPSLDTEDVYPILVATPKLETISISVNPTTKIQDIFDSVNFQLLDLKNGNLEAEKTIYNYKIERDSLLLLVAKERSTPISVDGIEIKVNLTDTIQFVNLQLKYELKSVNQDVKLIFNKSQEEVPESSTVKDVLEGISQDDSFSVKKITVVKPTEKSSGLEALAIPGTTIPFATTRIQSLLNKNDFSFLAGDLYHGLCHVKEKSKTTSEQILELLPQSDFKPGDFEQIVVDSVDGNKSVTDLFTERGKGDDFLVFIHGYNNSYEEGIRTTTQIAVGLDFKGTVGCFSWPSMGWKSSYPSDGLRIANAQPFFMDFLANLVENLPEGGKLHIISHSMGNRLSTLAFDAFADALNGKEMDETKRSQYLKIVEKLDHVVFAAPDVDKLVFKQRVEKFFKINTGAVDHIRATVFACESDKALNMSKWIHLKSPRFGQYPEIIEKVSIYNVIAPAVTKKGDNHHSYFYEWPKPFALLKQIINENYQDPAAPANIVPFQA